VTCNDKFSKAIASTSHSI